MCWSSQSKVRKRKPANMLHESGKIPEADTTILKLRGLPSHPTCPLQRFTLLGGAFHYSSLSLHGDDYSMTIQTFISECRTLTYAKGGKLNLVPNISLSICLEKIQLIPTKLTIVNRIHSVRTDRQAQMINNLRPNPIPAGRSLVWLYRNVHAIAKKKNIPRPTHACHAASGVFAQITMSPRANPPLHRLLSP